MSKLINATKDNTNMPPYETAYDTFSWKDVEKEFTWHETDKVNMAYEAIDRHAESWRKNKIALYYNDKKRDEKYTFQDMKYLSNQFGSVLQNLGIEKGERVSLFMPKTPELYISMMGTLKIGAISVPMYESFMRQAVSIRLLNSGASVLVTTRKYLAQVPYETLPELKHIIIVGEGKLPEYEGDINLYLYEEEMEKATRHLQIEWIDHDDGMIIHYTSGTTDQPKGILLAHQAMIQQYQTAKWVLDLKEDDIFWCTADPGWVTGTSYGVFGPWLNGASNLIRGERFSPEDCYRTIEKYQVTVWLSAPTAYRRLMAIGNELADKYDLSSLRHLLSVGEPLNAGVIHWGMKVFDSPIHDHWWMTETSGIMISNYLSMPIKPGSMGKPFPGIEAAILDEEGNELPPGLMGPLCIKSSWPGMLKSVWADEDEMRAYFPVSKEWFYTRDLAIKDKDGYFWFQGRNDDLITTSGERIGPFEIEGKLLEHPAVAEAAVIGKPDPEFGEVIKAFVALRDGYEEKDEGELRKELKQFVKEQLATNSAPREIEFKEYLPKTQSGKIVRRALKKEDGEEE